MVALEAERSSSAPEDVVRPWWCWWCPAAAGDMGGHRGAAAVEGGCQGA
uniref:Uncharacterized protein n=1 Tax=Arundo donax TaxID=35708 RepID=A0A0A9HJ86_ARUDO